LPAVKDQNMGMDTENYRSGFVNILGMPNVGKSTLINALVGEKISIVSPKIQTTRHRILGIITEKKYQIVFSDTPGILEPRYGMQESMLTTVKEALKDADVILYLAEATDDFSMHENWICKIQKLKIPWFFVVNKVDILEKQSRLEENIARWQQHFPPDKILIISALHKFNLPKLLADVVRSLPLHPPYYPEEMFTDRSERFLASEIIREKIFLKYRQEIPYSAEVIITSFKEGDTLLRISADIILNKKSHKAIILGAGGLAIKETGTLARIDMEKFFEKKVYLELFVKVRENWRDHPLYLRQFGYNQ
jgi:GTPase